MLEYNHCHDRIRLNRLRELKLLLRGNPPLMEALALCRDRLPVPAWIGAGAIRNAVWDDAHGRAPALGGDIDVVFHDPCLAPGADDRFAGILRAACPRLAWDVTNQAHVHAWYPAYFGKDVAPLASLAEAVATWPDTATAVAVRLLPDGEFDVVAPFGLDDLFDLVLRWNPGRVSRDAFGARIDGKQWLRRWPRLRVVS